jgi:hypothetical protein
MRREEVAAMDLISRYFWVICLVVTGFNYFIGRRRIISSDLVSIDNASIAQSYLVRFSIASSLPWLIMGWGQIFGNVPTVWYYFRPQDRNLFVIAWFGLIFFIAVACAYWVFLANGAKKLLETQFFTVFGARGQFGLSERMIKLFAALGPLLVLGWICLAALMNLPLP